MAENPDKEQQTEEPTAKRLQEAIEKGNVPNSREVASFMMIATFTLLLAGASSGLMLDARQLLVPFIATPHLFDTDQAGISTVLHEVMYGSIAIMALPFMAIVIAALGSGIVQRGFIFSVEPIVPKLSKISVLEGVKRLFSSRSMVEFLKGIVKIVIASVIAFWAVYPELGHVKQLTNSTLESTMDFLLVTSTKILVWIAVAVFFIAILDFFYQKFQHIKSLRMSRQEIKDEFKQSEGDPMIKMRLRQLRMERARNRMMAAVPGADVVITNPTHFAVALSYDNQTMQAPKVVAKGQDLIALRIREIAEENNVPIVENPPLARALFAASELEQEIPVQHYEAVAKVISYVYQLKGKGFSR